MDLNELRLKNPNLPLYCVTDEAFAPYGRVLPCPDADGLSAALEKTPIPARGNCYVASDPALERLPVMEALRRTVYGELDIQAGYCNGNGFTLNAEEYHKCSEVNYTTTGLVLLLALPENLHDDVLRSEDVAGFYLPKRTLVEIHPRVLHFAPCRVSQEGFRCLVVLQRGTNEPLEGGADTTAPGEEKLLWMKNKWLICHPDSPQAAKGAFAGIEGENLTLKI
ncbi:MAG: DUF4867 family protein [Oscillospiraceae bacterium]|nr:DUF4867 family protein [Oscillospiraceae bacterium]